MPGALFKYLYHGWGSNDIRELRKFSTQLDMFIEKPQFKGIVHIGADGGTMHYGWLRSVSLPSYTLMAFYFFFFSSLPVSPRFESQWSKAVRGRCRGGATLAGVDIIANFKHSYINFQVWYIYYYLCLLDLSSQTIFIWMLSLEKVHKVTYF